jgi:DNA-binding response OmpR family regulator
VLKVHILIIEDEYGLADAISEMLKKENFLVDIITDGEDGENEALTGIYDLIILDVMLPNKNGFEILKTLKQEKLKTPIIMLTAKSEMDDKLLGLENGADDYITKPFHTRELLARVKNILKRNNDIEELNCLEFGDLKLDLSGCRLKCKENSIIINGKELELLQLIMINKNQIVNREVLANKIWGYDSEAEYNNVEVYISFIRKKLKILKSNVKIKAVRGVGYKLEVIND